MKEVLVIFWEDTQKAVMVSDLNFSVENQNDVVQIPVRF